MKVSLNWLRRHVDLPENAEEVAKALTSIGLEGEGTEEPGMLQEIMRNKTFIALGLLQKSVHLGHHQETASA